MYTHISSIQLSRQTVRGNNTAEKTTKYQQVTTFKAAVCQTSLCGYIAGKKRALPHKLNKDEVACHT
jgi:hypothetical protein